MEKISTKESIALIITIIMNNVVLISTQIIQETCSSASLINSIYICLLMLVVTGILCLLYKKFRGLDILDISKFLGGKILMWIVGLIFFSYYLFKISILLRRIIDCLQIVYYPNTNIIYIVALFLIATGICCCFRNNSIPKANYIILPILLASIIIVFIGNVKNFNLNAIYPLFGKNISTTFFSGISNMFAFSGIAYLYFLPPKMKEPQKFNKIAIVSILISSFFLILSIATILFIFNTSLSDSELFPLYIAVRYIEFGSFLQRLDSAFLLIWIISFISMLSIVVNLCTHIFKKLTNISDRKIVVFPVLLCIFGISMLIKDNAFLRQLENNVFKILFFTIIITVGYITLFLANIKKKIKTSKENINE